MTISQSLSRIAQNLAPDNGWTQDDYDHLKNIITALEEKQERENRRNEPNEALTLDELRGMRGEPVYVVRLHYGKLDDSDIRCSGWFLVESQMVHRRSGTYSENFYWDEYGKTWLAYRHKPADK